MGEPTIVIEKNVPVPMRDGTILRADVFRPAAPGRYPVILQRTPYNKSLTAVSMLMLDVLRVAGEGYAVVIQDSRGRYASEGTFYTFKDDILDGYDSVEWCAVQPWSDGNVGMYGASYVGATQWLAAISQPPHLKAIFPLITASDYHEGWAYQGGAFALGFNESWTMTFLAPDTYQRLMQTKPELGERLNTMLQGVDDMCQWFRHVPLNDFPLFGEAAPYFYDWLAHPDDDDYWRQLNIEDRHCQVQIPACNVGGWYDIFLGGTIRNYLGMRERGATPAARQGQKLILGPWFHTLPLNNVSGEVNYGLSTTALAMDLDGIHLRWFDYWLKGKQNGVLDDPPVRIFVMGENRWRNENEWPLARTQYTKYFLHSGGKANSLRGDGLLSPEPPRNEPADVYVADPRNPVPTRGGGLCCWPAAVPGGAFDQRSIEDRPDVLVYTTPVLDRDVEVTGPVTVTLYAETSAVDTDFTAKLVDVHPDGYARNLTDGILRGRYRESRGKAVLLKAGEVYEYTIDLWATSNLFKAGHRIRLDIASSNFPRFDRNPQTGEASNTASRLEPALQRVFHDELRPSHVVLPIIPR
jgi:putative CocE/NonD family hydrolase